MKHYLDLGARRTPEGWNSSFERWLEDEEWDRTARQAAVEASKAAAVLLTPEEAAEAKRQHDELEERRRNPTPGNATLRAMREAKRASACA